MARKKNGTITMVLNTCWSVQSNILCESRSKFDLQDTKQRELTFRVHKIHNKKNFKRFIINISSLTQNISVGKASLCILFIIQRFLKIHTPSLRHNAVVKPKVFLLPGQYGAITH